MRACFPIAIGMTVLLTASSAYATGYRIGPVSQQEGPSHASVGASIRVSSKTPSAPGSIESGSSAGLGEPSEGPGGRAENATPPSRETWCVAAGQSTVSPCYGVVPAPVGSTPPRKAGSTPPVNPAAIAASAWSRLSLVAGQIQTSPSTRTAGLAGAATWFWLSPAPSQQSLSVSAGAERVTVAAAVGDVRWSFGDGRSITAGPGVPYRPESSPSAAIRHSYQTRCLPGDRGHDPYVSSSCGANGYQVQVSVEWRISYQASGPVPASGSLPSRSTETSLDYPVSEARAFLTHGGGR
jgi:hypothetical protein